MSSDWETIALILHFTVYLPLMRRSEDQVLFLTSADFFLYDVINHIIY